MPRYSLYKDSNGALIERRNFAAGPSSLKVPGKGKTWVLDPAPALTEYQTENWDPAQKQSVAVAKPLADQKVIKRAAAKAKAKTIIGSGFSYTVPGGSAHTYQIDYAAQDNMTSIGAMFGIGKVNPHKGFWRDANNVKVTMDDAEVKDFFLAAAAYKQDIITNMWDLIDDIETATDQAELDAVDLDSGWPVN